MNTHIQQLKSKQWLWQGFREQQKANVIATGFEEFDKHLGGGLPEKGIFDVKTPLGIGEMRLFMPYLANKKGNGLLALISPPATINAEFLISLGIQLSRVIVIMPASQDNALWCAEQCLKSGACSSIVLWTQSIEVSQTRRLNLAANSNNASVLLMRDKVSQNFALPVSISVQLAPHEQGIKVSIDKQRGGHAVPSFIVNMHHLWPELAIPQPQPNIIPFKRAKAS